METFVNALSTGLNAFFGFKAYVILPVFMLILALVARMRATDAVRSAIKTGAGFAGVFIAFNFFVSQISPAISAIIALRGLDFPVMDVGWPPLAAITWSSSLTPVVIVLVMLTNLAMLFARATKTLYIDLWNYWHFALIGALLQSVSSSVFIALAASVLIAIYTIKTTEWSAPYVKRETGLDGIAISPISVSGFLPYAVAMNALFDAIPGVRSLKWDPSRGSKATEKGAIARSIELLQEPMVLGLLLGIALSVTAGYDVKTTLETAVNIAAVMFLLPRCGALIGEGIGEVSLAFKALMERKFPSLTGLSIAVDTGVLMTNASVIATGLIMIPISIALAFVIPGNKTIPLGDLPNLLSIMSVVTLVMGGNVVRSLLAGIPIAATFLLVASKLAPLFTEQARRAGMALGADGQLITAFTDGGNQLRYWFFWLFQGNAVALAIIPVVGTLLWFSWRKHKTLTRI